MTVAGEAAEAHVPHMATPENAPAMLPGVAETAPAWQAAPDPLLARRVDRKLDVETLVGDMHARFPVIMARLAE